MKLVPLQLSGLILVEPDVFGDARGFFMETWNQQRYREAGLDVAFVQDNLSMSRRGTLRGLHFQNPTPQGKLVSVLQGEVFDVAVDIRRSSPTFGQICCVSLSEENKQQLYIPPGFAHGFQVVSESALFHYKCTGTYVRENERAIRWNDPALAISWPLQNAELSDKDRNAPLLGDLPSECLFE